MSWDGSEITNRDILNIPLYEKSENLDFNCIQQLKVSLMIKLHCFT